MITLKGFIGTGAHADVYEAHCDLRDRVAVKLIRPNETGSPAAIAQAKALIRAMHPNVVAVYNVEKLEDPETGSPVDGIVMEYLDGPTLRVHLEAEKWDKKSGQLLGEDIISGIRHIHSKGLAHGDLHEGNIVVVQNRAKIIDILYTSSLSLLSTQPREIRLQNDVRDVRLLLRRILDKVDPTADLTTEFMRATGNAPTLDDLLKHFQAVLNSSERELLELKLGQALERMSDEGFVDSEQYATALAKETPDPIAKVLLTRVIEKSIFRRVHKTYVRKLWDTLSPQDRLEVAKVLGQAFDKEVPKGNWSPHVLFLYHSGREVWEALPTLSKLRLEKLMIDDILLGNYSSNAPIPSSGGYLGTWASAMFTVLEDRDGIVDNIASMLCQSYNNQNYIGKYFLKSLPKIADTPERKAKVIKGLRRAYADDARLIRLHLGDLPSDWGDEVKREISPD